MIGRRRTDRRTWLAALAATLLMTAGMMTPACAGVQIGLDIVAPPALVPIPSSPVEYAPSLGANYFFYGQRYYVFADGGWYAASAYNGPWVAIAPALVPLPVLGVPVRYYRVPPTAWAGWRRDRPPQWDTASRRPPEASPQHHAFHGAPHREPERPRG
jgi:hypothetical protein